MLRNFKIDTVSCGLKRQKSISARGHMEKTEGAFHYAKPTGQISVGIPEQNGRAFSGPTNWN